MPSILRSALFSNAKIFASDVTVLYHDSHPYIKIERTIVLYSLTFVWRDRFPDCHTAFSIPNAWLALFNLSSNSTAKDPLLSIIVPKYLKELTFGRSWSPIEQLPRSANSFLKISVFWMLILSPTFLPSATKELMRFWAPWTDGEINTASSANSKSQSFLLSTQSIPSCLSPTVLFMT